MRWSSQGTSKLNKYIQSLEKNPKTETYPPKNADWKTIFLFENGPFSDDILISFRGCKKITKLNVHSSPDPTKSVSKASDEAPRPSILRSCSLKIFGKASIASSATFVICTKGYEKHEPPEKKVLTSNTNLWKWPFSWRNQPRKSKSHSLSHLML